MFFQRLVGLFQLFCNCAKTQACNFWIRTAVAFFLFAVGVVLFLVVLVVGRRFRRGLRGFGFDFLRTCGTIIVRVDVTTEDVGQAATFGRYTLVICEDAVDGAGEVSDSAHHLTNAFLDAFGDFDLAFAGQQFDGAHFTHVHAHRVGGATDVGFDRSECGRGLLGSGFIGIGFGQQQGIGIRGNLEYIDAHVVDHANDVFHLFRIGNILR